MLQLDLDEIEPGLFSSDPGEDPRRITLSTDCECLDRYTIRIPRYNCTRCKGSGEVLTPIGYSLVKWLEQVGFMRLKFPA